MHQLNSTIISTLLAGSVRRLGAALCASLLAQPAAASAQDLSNLSDLSLEELLNVEVISVSKKTQRLADTSAAIYVITAEDIRRSGVSSIPEALRMAPGIQVAKIDSNKWAITSRGFNGRFANKLLVLMDGRSVYTTLHSGVFWDVQDTLLEDIERIEVIRGPGATVWGANAVNGVINIITRRTQDTQGTLVSTIAGSEEKHNFSLRHGATTEQGTAWRIYAKSFEQDAAVDASGNRTNDDWRSQRVGFRSDGKLTDQTSLTLQGDAYKGTAGQSQTIPMLTPPYSLISTTDTQTSGSNLRGKAVRKLDNGDLSIQAYYDRLAIDDLNIHDVADTLDLDIQRHLQLAESHDLVMGAGYRRIHDRWLGGQTRLLDPDHTDQLFSAFIQDEIKISERWSLTLGSKFEHNDYTGWEILPSARAYWRASPSQSVWLAISRAARTPSRAETNSLTDVSASPPSVIIPIPQLLQARGNTEMSSEQLTAYEMGWRFNASRSLSLDIAGFYNNYDRLLSQTLSTSLVTSPVPHYVITTNASNQLAGHSYGMELVLEARPADDWRLQATYSNLHMNLHEKNGSENTSYIGILEGSSPRNQLSVRSEFNINEQTNFDIWATYVDRLPALEIGSYTSLNMRLAWRPNKKVELSLVGQNLLRSHHAEFRPDYLSTTPTEVQRSAYAAMRLLF